MDELKDEINALKVYMKELVDVNTSLKNEVQALKSQMSALSLTNRETAVGQQGRQKQQAVEFMAFTETMPDKYSDVRFLTMDERKEIKFAMELNRIRCLRLKDGQPSGFYFYDRETKTEKDNGLTCINLGIFLTPIAGRYRFDVWSKMRDIGKADWYICYVPKEFYNIPEQSDSDDDYDSNSSSSDDDDDDEEVKEKNQEKAEKDIIFKEKSRRHLLFTLDPEKSAMEGFYFYFDYGYKQGSVGIDCDKGLRFWIEAEFAHGSSACFFEGRLVC